MLYYVTWNGVSQAVDWLVPIAPMTCLLGWFRVRRALYSTTVFRSSCPGYTAEQLSLGD